MARASGLPPNVSEFKDRHGTWRLRFRQRGRPTHYFRALPGSPEFAAELAECRAGKPVPAEKSRARVPPGSLSALIALYYTTPAFTGLAESSRSTYRNMLERFREDHGSKSVRNLTRAHIKAIIGALSATPSHANNLLDRLRLLMQLALDEGWRKDDPTLRLKGFKERAGGFHTWTEDEIAAFEAHYPIGTTARMALALLLYTGQRRSDVVGLGRQHVADNRIWLRQGKTGTELSLPIHPDLARVLQKADRGQLTFLVNELGRPFTANGFGNKMRDWCDAAGLAQCSAHGLRKAAARRLAEAGKSHSEIKSITGHTTDKEVTRYTRAASQKTLSDSAITGLTRKPKPRTTVG